MGMMRLTSHLSLSPNVPGYEKSPLSSSDLPKTKSGQVAKEHIDRINKKVNASLNEEFLASKDYVPHRRDWLSSHWLDLSHLRVKPEILKNVGKAITSLPGNLLANRAEKKRSSSLVRNSILLLYYELDED